MHEPSLRGEPDLRPDVVGEVHHVTDVQTQGSAHQAEGVGPLPAAPAARREQTGGVVVAGEVGGGGAGAAAVHLGPPRPAELHLRRVRRPHPSAVHLRAPHTAAGVRAGGLVAPPEEVVLEPPEQAAEKGLVLLTPRMLGKILHRIGVNSAEIDVVSGGILLQRVLVHHDRLASGLEATQEGSLGGSHLGRTDEELGLVGDSQVQGSSKVEQSRGLIENGGGDGGRGQEA